MTDKETYTVVKAYFASSKTTLVVVIPKEAREKIKIDKGTKFLVKSDEKGVQAQGWQQALDALQAYLPPQLRRCSG